MSDFKMSVIDPSGTGRFIEPLVVVTKGKESKIVNLLPSGGDLARNLAYVCMSVGEDKDTCQDKTKREAGTACLTVLSSEKMKDSLFTFYHPIKYEDRANHGDVAKWLPILTVGIGDMVTTAKALDVSNKALESVQNVITKACESMTSGTVKNLNPFPVYCDSVKTVGKTRGGSKAKGYGDIF